MFCPQTLGTSCHKIPISKLSSAFFESRLQNYCDLSGENNHSKYLIEGTKSDGSVTLISLDMQAQFVGYQSGMRMASHGPVFRRNIYREEPCGLIKLCFPSHASIDPSHMWKELRCSDDSYSHSCLQAWLKWCESGPQACNLSDKVEIELKTCLKTGGRQFREQAGRSARRILEPW